MSFTTVASNSSCQYGTTDEFKTVYDCALCPALFSSQDDFQNHIQLEHRSNFLPCITCGKLYSSSKCLVRHIDTAHKLFLYCCGKEGCSFRTTVFKTFLFHLVKCISSGFPCYSCKTTFSTPESLIVHMGKNVKVGKEKNSASALILSPEKQSGISAQRTYSITKTENVSSKISKAIIKPVAAETKHNLTSRILQVVDTSGNPVSSTSVSKMVQNVITVNKSPIQSSSSDSGIKVVSSSHIPSVRLIAPKPLFSKVYDEVLKNKGIVSKSACSVLPKATNVKPFQAFTVNQGLLKGKVIIVKQRSKTATNSPLVQISSATSMPNLNRENATTSVLINKQSSNAPIFINKQISNAQTLINQRSSKTPGNVIQPKQSQIQQSHLQKLVHMKSVIVPSSQANKPAIVLQAPSAKHMLLKPKLVQPVTTVQIRTPNKMIYVQKSNLMPQVSRRMHIGRIDATILSKKDGRLPTIGQVGSEQDILASLGERTTSGQLSDSVIRYSSVKTTSKTGKDTSLSAGNTACTMKINSAYSLAKPNSDDDVEIILPTTDDEALKWLNSRSHVVTSTAVSCSSVHYDTSSSQQCILNSSCASSQIINNNQGIAKIPESVTDHTYVSSQSSRQIADVEVIESKPKSSSNKMNVKSVMALKKFGNNNDKKKLNRKNKDSTSEYSCSEESTESSSSDSSEESGLNFLKISNVVGNHKPKSQGLKKPISGTNEPATPALKQRGQFAVRRVKRKPLKPIDNKSKVNKEKVVTLDTFFESTSSSSSSSSSSDNDDIVSTNLVKKNCFSVNNERLDENLLQHSFAYCNVTEKSREEEVCIEFFPDATCDENCQYCKNSSLALASQCDLTTNEDEFLAEDDSLSSGSITELTCIPDIDAFCDSSTVDELITPLVIDESITPLEIDESITPQVIDESITPLVIDESEESNTSVITVLPDKPKDDEKKCVRPGSPKILSNVNEKRQVDSKATNFLLNDSFLTVREMIENFKSGRCKISPGSEMSSKMCLKTQLQSNKSDCETAAIERSPSEQSCKDKFSIPVVIPGDLVNSFEKPVHDISIASSSSKTTDQNQICYGLQNIDILKAIGNVQSKGNSNFFINPTTVKTPVMFIDDSMTRKVLLLKILPKDPATSIVKVTNSVPCVSTSIPNNSVGLSQPSSVQIPMLLTPSISQIASKSIMSVSSSSTNNVLNTASYSSADLEGRDNDIIKNLIHYMSYLKNRKSESGLKLMSSSSDFFKCMHHKCMFTSNCPSEFLKHTKIHDNQQLECPYCLKELDGMGNLLRHSVRFHRRRIFQCSLCFFRACSKMHVQFHIRFHHVDVKGCVITGTPIATELAKLPDELPLFRFNVRNIVCAFPECCFTSNSVTDVAFHMMQHNERKDKFPCMSCDHRSSTIFNWINHLKMHSIYLLHCLFCSYGCNKRLLMLNHLVSHHADYPLMTYVRTSEKLLFIFEYYLSSQKKMTFTGIQCCTSPSNCYCYLLFCPEFEGSSNRIKSFIENIKIKKIHFRRFDCLYCDNESSTIAKMEKHLQTEHFFENRPMYYYCMSQSLGNTELRDILDFKANAGVKIPSTVKETAVPRYENHIIPSNENSRLVFGMEKLKHDLLRTCLSYSTFKIKYLQDSVPVFVITLPSFPISNVKSTRQIMKSFYQLLKFRSSKQIFFHCVYCIKYYRSLKDLRVHWKSNHVQTGKRFLYHTKIYQPRVYETFDFSSPHVDTPHVKDENSKMEGVFSRDSLIESGNLYDRVKRNRANQSLNVIRESSTCKTRPVRSEKQCGKRKAAWDNCSSCKKAKVDFIRSRNSPALNSSTFTLANRTEIQHLYDTKITVIFDGISCPVKIPLFYLEPLLNLLPRVLLRNSGAENLHEPKKLKNKSKRYS